MTTDRLEAVLRDAVECRCRPNLDDIDAQNILFALDGLRREAAEKDAEIERLKKQSEVSMVFAYCSVKMAAAGQAREQSLRDHFKEFTKNEPCDCGCPSGLAAVPVSPVKALAIARSALSEPSDTTALEALIAKAGEVMRDSCSTECWKRSAESGFHRTPEEISSAIRALPGVTMEDIK